MSAFVFQTTKKVRNRTVGEDGRLLLNFTGLWPCRFSTVPFILLTISAPYLPSEQLLTLQHLEARRTRSGGDWCNTYPEWDGSIVAAPHNTSIAPLESNWAPFNRHWSDTCCVWDSVIQSRNIEMDKIRTLVLSGLHYKDSNSLCRIYSMPCIALNASYVLAHVTFRTTPRGRYCHFHHDFLGGKWKCRESG